MLTRREGIQAAALTALSYSRILGANERIQFGLIGCGERGLYVAGIFQKTAQVDLRAVCDVFGDRTTKPWRRPPARRRLRITASCWR